MSSEPTTVLTYLFKMTHVLSSSYDHLRIVGSEPGLMKSRMALYDAARIVLNNGMRLLGLTPVERYTILNTSGTPRNKLLIVWQDVNASLYTTE